MQTIEINCKFCGKSKSILLKEYKRQTEKGRKNWFCDDSCAGKFNNLHNIQLSKRNKFGYVFSPPGKSINDIPERDKKNLAEFGYANYTVTRDGYLWSHSCNRWKLPQIDRCGYINVVLFSPVFLNAIRTGIHRLVALAFIPNPKRKPQVNHINNNPAINIDSNLEWCTEKENTLYAISQNRR